VQFEAIDTQAKVDNVYLFTGTSTIQDQLMARFSGKQLPPVIISPTNEVLVWFATDRSVTAAGWTLRYVATDEPTTFEITGQGK